MTVLTEGSHAGGFLVSEANKTLSRSTVTLKSGENLQAGTVVQKQQSTGKYVQYDAGDSDRADGAGSVAVLLAAVDASAADTEAVVIDKDAEVNGEELVWADDQDTGDRDAGTAALLAVGIKVR